MLISSAIVTVLLFKSVQSISMLRSLYEIVIHVHNFRNVQLFYQGFYSLSFNVYLLEGKSTHEALHTDLNKRKKITAHPYAHFNSIEPNCHRESASSRIVPLQLASQRTKDPRIVNAAKVDKKTSTFYSKQVLVRFCEEEVLIDDFVHFRVEGLLQEEEDQLLLQAQLIFHGMEHQKESNPTSLESQADGISKEQVTPKNESEYQPKKSVPLKFILTKPRAGIHQFMPLPFHSGPFSSCISECSVHTLCLDYRYTHRGSCLLYNHSYRYDAAQLSDFANMPPQIIEAHKNAVRNKIHDSFQQFSQQKPPKKKPHQLLPFKPSQVMTQQPKRIVESQSNNKKLKSLKDIFLAISSNPIETGRQMLVNAVYDRHLTLLNEYGLLYLKLFKNQEQVKQYLKQPYCLGIHNQPAAMSSRELNTSTVGGISKRLSLQQVRPGLHSAMIQKELEQSLTKCNQLSAHLLHLWQNFVLSLRLAPSGSMIVYQRAANQKGSWWLSLFDAAQETIVNLQQSSATTLISTYVSSEIKYTEANQEDQYRNGRSNKLITVKTKLKQLSQLRTHLCKRIDNYLTFQKKGWSVQQYGYPLRATVPRVIREIYHTSEGPNKQYVQSSCQDSSENPQEKSTFLLHLVVLCHGFQGHSYDMHTIKGAIVAKFPESVVLCSSANEERTDSNFFESGQRLANQVRNYLRFNLADGSLVKKISFIGHSLGGLIIRAALPHLHDLKSKFNMFISLSSPHLGYAVHGSFLIGLGLWFLRKTKDSQVLNQLTLKDMNAQNDEELKSTALYRLSQCVGLEFFRKVLLVGSEQDEYAPVESARLQLPQDDSMGSDSTKLFFKEMAVNILQRLNPLQLERWDYEFDIPNNSLDAFIGRSAHIRFLDNHLIMDFILKTHSNYFQ